MKGFVLLAAISVSFAAATPAGSQTLASSGSVEARTRAIVASFNKSKRGVKERRGIRVEKYKEVRSTAVVRANSQDYSGSYEVQGLGFSLDLRVNRNGDVSGAGVDPVSTDNGVMRRFTLRDARINGALLTATKVYAGGSTQRFEGVFIDRTSFDHPGDKGFATFGLGVVSTPIHVSGITLDRYFYERER